MTDFQFHQKVEALDAYLAEIKSFAISLGASPSAFSEAEAKWEEIKNEAKKKVSGGIISPSALTALDGEVDGGEHIIPSSHRR